MVFRINFSSLRALVASGIFPIIWSARPWANQAEFPIFSSTANFFQQKSLHPASRHLALKGHHMASVSIESAGHASICRRRELKVNPDNFHLNRADPHMRLKFPESLHFIYKKKYPILLYHIFLIKSNCVTITSLYQIKYLATSTLISSAGLILAPPIILYHNFFIKSTVTLSPGSAIST